MLIILFNEHSYYPLLINLIIKLEKLIMIKDLLLTVRLRFIRLLITVAFVNSIFARFRGFLRCHSLSLNYLALSVEV